MQGFCKFRFSLVIALALILSVRAVLAIDAIPNDPLNKRWHVSEKTMIATFLGGDKPETAVLVLDKTAVQGRTLTIETDGKYVILQATATPHVGFPVSPQKDGGYKIKLVGGDQPALFFDGKEQVDQEGKWIQILQSDDKVMHLEISDASFARVKFDSPDTGKAPVAPAVAQVIDLPHPAGNELLHNVTANQLTGATHAFSEGISKKCVACGGTGKVSEQYQTGSVNHGPFNVPTYSNREVQCTRCKGSGIDRANDEVLLRQAQNIVKDLSQLKEDDSRRQDALTKAYNLITDKMIGDEKAWVMLTANGKSVLAQRKPDPGTAVVSFVEVKKSIKLGEDKRRYLVRVLGTDKEVYVDDPALADELKNGHALMGGVVADAIGNNPNDKITTLHGGFLVAPKVDHAWYWWYRDKE
jgi:hypothetical protein